MANTLYLAFFLFLSFCTLTVFASPFYRRDVISATATPLITQATTPFGTFIEGAATDASGNVFAVNFGNATQLATIGKINATSGTASLFFSQSPAGSTAFNGIRFADSGKTIYIADKGGKRLVTGTTQNIASTAKTVCFNKTMLSGVPNDLAITTSGKFIYLSGQSYTDDTTSTDGEIWLCNPSTNTTRRLAQMGRTNGIEINPTNNLLYVSEAFNKGGSVVSNVIWKYTLDSSSGSISNQQLFVNFSTLDNSASVDVDGMRTDVAGNLYVTRNGGGEVAKFASNGTLLAKIKVSTQFPTNLEFGGREGKTLFIVGRCGSSNFGEGVGCVDTFKNDLIGRAFSELQAGSTVRNTTLRNKLSGGPGGHNP